MRVMRAQTGGRFIISKLGIAFVLEYLNQKIITVKEQLQSCGKATGGLWKNRRAEGFYVGHYQVNRVGAKDGEQWLQVAATRRLVSYQLFT